MDRNGAMEHSQSVGPPTQIATPSNLGLIMSPLHHGMPTLIVAHARDMMRPARDNDAGRCGRVDPCGLPLGDLLSHVRHAQVSWPV